MFEPGKKEEMSDNQKIKEEWTSALLELMQQLKQWTVELIKLWEAEPEQRVIPNVIETTIEKYEEHIGKYYAPSLVIMAENYLVDIRPVGRFAIGAIGQVNMTGNKRSFSFLYSRRKGWVVMENRKPLTRELYFELLNNM